jgi:hypothetical protein
MMSFQAGLGILTENSKNDTQIIAIFCVTMGKIGIFASKLMISRKNRLLVARRCDQATM